MARSDSETAKREHRKNVRWVISIFFITILVSGLISLLSDSIMSHSGMFAAFFILLVIIAVGILFDIIGVAVTSADEKPFHSMASRKVRGAPEAIGLLRNASRVSSICNDVVGDICGVISGSASAVIALRVLEHFTFSWPQIVSLAMSALVAGLTVGGKAVGKLFAIQSCTEIVFRVGKLINTRNRFLAWFRDKKV